MPPSAQLYNALYDYALSLPSCLELTIEDPSEQFEDLRDRNDLKRLMLPGSVGDSEQIKRGPPVDKAWLEKARRERKYAKVGAGSPLVGGEADVRLHYLRGSSSVSSRCCCCATPT